MADDQQDQQYQGDSQGSSGDVLTQRITDSQRQVDETFASLSSASHRPSEFGRQMSDAYWDLADSTIRQARRVSELQTMALFRQEIVADVARVVSPMIAQQVIAQITPLLTQKRK